MHVLVLVLVVQSRHVTEEGRKQHFLLSKMRECYVAHAPGSLSQARRKAEEERRRQGLQLHPHLQQQLVQGDDVGSDSLGGIWHEMVGLMTPTESTMDARLAIR
eukprot:1100323-Pelagomonas_calceolata.AAC.1